MKTTKLIMTVLFVLVTAQVASAYYCPSTGRWLSRDPMGEPGFENLRAAGMVPKIGQIVSPASLTPGRWVNRDTDVTKKDPDRYAMVRNNPINLSDAYGLWVVCRRAVRVATGEPSYYGWFAHVDIVEDCSKCGNSTADEDVSCYPIKPDPKCKCPPDTAKCLQDNPYSAGEGTWGSNCQSNTRERLHKCCLIAPDWHPDFYAYPLEPPLGPAPPFL